LRIIKATIVTGSEQQLKLMEVEENLERAHLSDDERALLKAKERELRGERLEAFQAAIEEAPPTPATAKGGRGKKGGVRAAARKAGVSQTTAQRHAPKVNRGSVSDKPMLKDAGVNKSRIVEDEEDDEDAQAKFDAEVEPASACSIPVTCRSSATVCRVFWQRH
jgi:hypothetical protein